MIKIVLDTNILVHAGFKMTGPDMAILKQAIDRGDCELVVPRIVFEETVNKYREKLEERLQAVSGAITALNALLPSATSISAHMLYVDELVQTTEEISRLTWSDSGRACLPMRT